MVINQNMMDELNALTQYSLDSMQIGIKVHHDADPTIISAIGRLHDKGLVTQVDGGYLTSCGMEAATHAHQLISALEP